MTFDKEQITTSVLPHIRSLWISSETAFPSFLPPFSAVCQKENEKWILEKAEQLQQHIKTFPSSAAFRIKLPFLRAPMQGNFFFPPLQRQRQKRWIQETEALFDTLLLSEPILGIRNGISETSLTGLKESIKTFLRKARSFAPDMEPEDLGQALRNFMVYAIFREQNGLFPSCPSSIFGYSMLYPYTDNFLDDPSKTDAEKSHYNRFIRDKIKGRTLSPASLHEEKTGLLLDDIAAVYTTSNRGCNAEAEDIKEGLLLMLEAQEISQKQVSCTALTQQDILNISIYKGGLSVLIDRFFVELPLTEEDVLFYFGFGFLLQLCDDLQDIGQDKQTGSHTLLSCCRTAEETEECVNRIFSYTAALFKRCPGKNRDFTDFLLQSCYELILSSAAGSGVWFEPCYLKRLEKYFPVSLAFLDEQKSRMPAAFPDSGKDQVMEMLDVFLR